MRDIDGSAGGGQLVRTALSLSAVTGTSFTMEGIRADRPNPGLAAQHLACVEALAAVTDADVGAGEDGDAEPAIGTERLRFEPGPVAGGAHAVDIGTAGSVALLADAVLPVASVLEAPLRLTVRGGTDVAWSPPVEYLGAAKLPLLRRHGLAAALEIHRRGFYRAGGGAVTLQVAPSALEPLGLREREPADVARVFGVASEDLAGADVADRGAAAAAEGLAADGLEVVERTATVTATRSTGAAVVVVLDSPPDGTPAGFSALAERGRSAEAVAADAVAAARGFRRAPGAVDPHMADQLVPYLALAGGAVRVPRVTNHVATCVDLVGSFGYPVTVEEGDSGAVLVGDAEGG